METLNRSLGNFFEVLFPCINIDQKLCAEVASSGNLNETPMTGIGSCLSLNLRSSDVLLLNPDWRLLMDSPEMLLSSLIANGLMNVCLKSTGGIGDAKAGSQ